MLELLPAQLVSIHKASNLLQWTSSKSLLQEGCNLLLFSSIQCLLSVGIRSYFTQRDVCRKTEKMYLSIVEEYFSVKVTDNLSIGLMNKHSTQKVVLLILPSFLNIVFSLVFKHRTDWCSASRLLYTRMVCFQIIAP